MKLYFSFLFIGIFIGYVASVPASSHSIIRTSDDVNLLQIVGDGETQQLSSLEHDLIITSSQKRTLDKVSQQTNKKNGFSVY